jgi:peptidoglycan/LPS O-acetylase OafA/YrhL
MPLMPKEWPHANGLYEVTMVIVVFPLLILCGAHSQIGKIEMAVCKFAGRISYPVYILHYPFLLIYMNFVTFTKPDLQTAHIAGAASFVIVMVFAWLAVKFFDEPVRNWLKPLTRKGKV